VYVAQPPFINRIDLKVYDALLPLRAAQNPSEIPVIIDIDEASLAEYGQWPWPRYLVADLLEALNESEVAAIGVDIMFSEKDRSSPEQIRNYLLRDKSVNLTFGDLPENLYDYDGSFAETVGRTPVVLGAFARFDGASTKIDAPSSLAVVERESPDAAPYIRFLRAAKNAVLPLPSLRDKAPLGFINAPVDGDGIVRQVPLLIQVNNAAQPSLALRTLMLGLETKKIVTRSGPDGLESIQVESFIVPVSPQGGIHIPFIGPKKTYPYISAADVLQKKIPPEALQGKIAFVGTSAPGLMDMRATPLDSFYPGVEIHAAVVDAILAQNAISLPPWTPALQFLGILGAGLAATLAFGFAGPVIYLPVAGALLGASVLTSRYFFRDGFFVSPLYAVMTTALLGAVLLLLRFWQEARQKHMLRATFSRYVSPEVVKRITKMRGNLFAGEERELSILFTDIRGFTSIAEKLSPQQIVNLLGRYFTPMTALVRKGEGTLDKFIGDALMAFWNAPLDVSGHAVRAVDAALSMQEKLLTLNEELRVEFGVDIRIGAGIHTGPVYVGNMGSAELINYTLIGDNVNLASRLEGLCPQYGVGLVVSGETRAGCSDAFVFQYLDTLRVKGKSQPVSVYAPMRPEAATARHEELLSWREACELYRSGNFGTAADALADLRERFSEVKLYAVYAERVRVLLRETPEHWDGIWTATNK
jgi:adenylate cyclase